MILRLGLLCLQWAFYAYLSNNLQDLYEYSGIGYRRPSAISLLLSIGALVLVAATLTTGTTKPSEGAMWLLASFVVVPTLAVAAVNPLFSSGTSQMASLAVLIGFLIPAVLLKMLGPPRTFPPSGLLSTQLFLAVVLTLSVVAIVTVVVGYGVSSLDLSFDDVSVRRLEAREAVSPYPGAAYLVSWLKVFLIPLLFVLSIQWRTPWLAVVAAVGAFAIFSFAGEKVTFVYPLIAIVLLLSLRRGPKRLGGVPWFGGFLTFGIIGVSVLVGRAWQESGLDVLVARRFGLVPGLLTHHYVNFAESEGFTWYAQSWLKPYSTGDAGLALGFRVGQAIDPGGALNANANLWADGFASAGLVGVAVSSGMLLIVLRLMDGLALSRDSFVAGASLGTVAFSYVNGYFHTSLLTGGVIFAMMLVWAMPRGPERFTETAHRPVRWQAGTPRPRSSPAKQGRTSRM